MIALGLTLLVALAAQDGSEPAKRTPAPDETPVADAQDAEGQDAEAQDAVPQDDGANAEANEEWTVEVADDPFERRPQDLPRAAAERWAGFFATLATEGGAERLAPKPIRDRQALAETLYSVRDYRGALGVLYGILEDEPDFPPALIVLGTGLFRLRRYGDAAVAFERFAEVAPDQVGRTQALGHCYYTLGDYDRARDHYARVIESGTRSAGAVRGLALSNWRLGDVERALELLDTVLESAPDHYETLVWKAQLLYEEEAFADALHLVERAETLAPHEPRPLFLQSRCLYELERDDEADAVRGRWKELDRLTQDVRRIEGRLYFEERPYGLAIELAQLCRTTRDIDRARDALAVAERSRPAEVDVVDFRLFALEVLWDVGDREGADIAAAALRIDGESSVAAWKRLEQHYAQVRDRRAQIHAGEMWRRLAGGED